MTAVPLGTLFTFIRNGLNVKQDKSGNGLPISRIETISDATIDGSRVGYANLKEAQCADWLLQVGDILFSHINSVEHVGKCALYQGTPPKLVHGMNLLCLRPDTSKLVPEFARHLIRTMQFRSKLLPFINKAVNQASVSIGNFKSIEVNVPPLPEQRRIAAILDKADSLRAKRRAALAQLNGLTQSIFLEMFGDPVTNERDWPTARLDEIADVKLGKMLDEKQRTGLHGRPYLRNANVQWHRFDLTEVFQMDFDERERSIFGLAPGDLLICEGGEPGRCAVWQGQIAECYFQKALHRCRCDLRRAEPTYVAHLLWFLSHRGGLTARVTSATIAHLTAEKLKQLRVPLPALSLQRQFLSRLGAMERLRDLQTAYDAKANALFASLQHQAFAGAL